MMTTLALSRMWKRLKKFANATPHRIPPASPSLSFVGVIVGEFLVGKAGLGYLIVYSSQIFKLDNVMMSVCILAVMAAVMYKIVSFIENKYIK